MNYDLGISKGTRPSFLYGIPKDRELEFVIFALTPGIPWEYVEFLCYLNRSKHRYKTPQIVESLRHIAEPLALENAASITVEDGYNMIKVVCNRSRQYRGRKPHWASIALAQICRERGVETTAAELGVSSRSLSHWRKSAFHPLSLQPLRPAASVRTQRVYQTY